MRIVVDHLTEYRYRPSAVANRPEWVNPIQEQYCHAGGVHAEMNVRLKIHGGVR